ncbi:MAG: glycosyltransferase [Acidobacteria bacterium]|nr:glycosyltransferase [Acidobacteriota bacterium]
MPARTLTDVTALRPPVLPAPDGRVYADGKFLGRAGERFLIKGVTYGTFAPDAHGVQFPPLSQVTRDFAAMVAAGLNTVRVYTPPPLEVLDAAGACGLQVMAGLPWAQHIAFLDDASTLADARESVLSGVAAVARHPAVALCALGNEIPASVVRWHGASRIEEFLASLYADAKTLAPDTLFTYVNFPPTEFLDLSCFDVASFNVYLHRDRDLRAYLARLQQVAGLRPLLLAEAGADSVREGLDGQARITAGHIRAAFEEGACGAVAFAWTDEWWRGGNDITDWHFGLVDRDREPKPALTAVSQAFADAPFAPTVQQAWPRVSVVVCAYNAADTIGECLASLAQLSYPDVETIVINDGSRDDTGDVARTFAGVRVIDIPNGGLSAARNLGLQVATGEIVAYTDADVRVDRDWLTFLVQPFVQSDVVGCGGPNVVPPDDPWLAQCVARAPGGPTHVLLDDRTAEHVPGCNMAFRRAALAAIGGFNPIYLRAGDDVDVCWRLMAGGGRIGFAPAALVWHRHRASVRAYWRQQVGYGEGEVWLMHQHPDKFAGGHVLWHGRIYSPLPYIRSLTSRRLDTGVWGLEAFPSVYHTGAQPWAYLPHSMSWHVATVVLLGLGALLLGIDTSRGAGWLALLMAFGAAATTAWRCLDHARRTDVASVAPLPGRSPRTSRWILRATIAWLHVIQPVARIRGRLRGWLEPPQVPAVAATISRATARPLPHVGDAWSALRLLAGASAEDRYWSERWLSIDHVLHHVLDALRLARLTPWIDISDGLQQSRDVSLALGRWGWYDLAALVEEHAGGRVLVRVRTTLRPSALTVALAVVSFGAILAASMTTWSRLGPLPAFATMLLAFSTLAYTVYRSAGTLAGLRGVVRHAFESLGASPIGGARPHVRFAPDLALWGYVARSALASLFVVGLAIGGAELVHDAAVTTAQRLQAVPVETPEVVPGPAYRAPTVGLAVAPNGDLYLADANGEAIRRVSAAGVTSTVAGMPMPASRTTAALPRGAVFDTPGGVAVAANGDLFVADTQGHRVYRVDRTKGTAVVVAGDGKAGFAGDGGPATAAQLNQPTSVAVDRKDGLVIADAANHRVRRVDIRTGKITTIAGDGTIADSPDVGDDGPAVSAHLAWPSDLAVSPSGDMFVADTGHHRVRRIDGRTGRISTIAGNGLPGAAGDGGPARAANLSAPTGLALVSRKQQVTLYIADSSNGRVRVVTPDGVINTLAIPNALKFGAPARLAYHPGGWLYIAGDQQNELAAVTLDGRPASRARLPRTKAPVRRAM